MFIIGIFIAVVAAGWQDFLAGGFHLTVYVFALAFYNTALLTTSFGR